MKSFWWFEENAIAGMARPGFNATRWFDLPFDEAVLMGWLGQHSSGEVELESFRRHLATYAPRIFKFYGLDDVAGRKATEIFERDSGILEILRRLKERLKVFKSFDVDKDRLHFELCDQRISYEIERLKENGVQRVVSLTERHHSKDELEKHFGVHHIGIEDLGAPQIEQAQELARIIQEARSAGETLAVHCLAGIGRTSTMIIAAHLLLGERLETMKVRIAKANPSFVLTGAQGDFIESLASRGPDRRSSAGDRE